MTQSINPSAGDPFQPGSSSTPYPTPSPQLGQSPLSQVLPAAASAYTAAHQPLQLQPRFTSANVATVIDSFQKKMAGVGSDASQIGAMYPTSTSLNQLTQGKGTAEQSQHQGWDWGRFGKTLWDSTGGAFIKHAQDHPWETLAEVGGGILLGAGIIATGGLLGAALGAEAAATLMAAGGVAMAGMTLPGLISAAQAEAQNPSDENTAHLLVNAGGTLLAAVPAARGITGLKAGIEASQAEIATIKSMSGAGEIVSYLTKKSLIQASGIDAAKAAGKKVSGAFTTRTEAPTGLWRQNLPTGDALGPALDKLKPQNSADTEALAKLREADAHLHALMDNAGVRSMDQLDTADQAKVVPITDHMKGEWAAARAEVGKRFGFAVTPYHLPFDPVMGAAEEKVFTAKVEQPFLAMRAGLRAASDYGLRTDGTTINLQATLEGVARGMVGPVRHAGNQTIRGLHTAMTELLGETWTNRNSPRLREILWSLEPGSPSFNLTDKEKVAARMIRETLDLTTAGNLRRGRLQLEYGDRVPIRRVPLTGHASGVPAYMRSLSSAEWSTSKAWEANFSEQELESGGAGTIPILDEAGNLKEVVPELAPRQTNYQAYRALEARRQKWEATAPVLEKRPEIIASRADTAFQSLKSVKVRATNALDRLEGEIADTGRALTEMRDSLQQHLFEHEGLKGAPRVVAKAQAHDMEMTVRRAEREYRKTMTRFTETRQRLADTTKKLDEHHAALTAAHGAQVADAIHADAAEWEKIARGRPEDHTLMDPVTMLETEIRRFTLDSHRSAFFQDMTTNAQVGLDKYLTAHPQFKVPGSLGAGIRAALGEEGLQQFVAGKRLADSETPLTLPSSAFKNEKDAQDAGYAVLRPAIGSRGQINHQEAIYAPTHIVKEFRAGVDAAQHVDQLPPAAKFIEKWTSGVPRKLIFAVPVVHMFNEASRMLAQIVADPVVGTSSLAKLMHWRLSDPEAYQYFLQRHYLAGGQPFHATDMIDTLHTHAADATGHQGWLGGIRNAAGVLSDHTYGMMQQALRKTVEDNGLLAHMMMEARLKVAVPTMNEVERAAAAAEYANNIKGTVNPLYMSKLWRHMRGLSIFAPSYQASWLRGLESVVQQVPGGTRIGALMAKRYPGISPVRLKYMQTQAYREVVRAQAMHTITGLAMTLVSYDMLNQIGSGRHIWQNESGRTMDVDLSNFMPPIVDPASGAVKRSYVSIVPGLSQQRDFFNALGVGHQYGLAHLASDAHFQQADAFGKAAETVTALLDGIGRVAPNKTSTTLQSLVAAVGGVDPALWLRGNIQRVPRAQALTYLMPQGLDVRQQLRQQSQVDPATGQPKGLSPMEYAQREGANLLGLPSVYEMGAERPDLISSDDYQKYVSSQQDLHTQAVQNWQAVTDGTMPISTWIQEYYRGIDKSLAADKAIFGDSSPAGALSAARLQLRQKYGLDGDVAAMPKAEYYARRDAMDNAWKQVLDSASPQTKAVWWDHHRKQWTDGDYLYWYTGQIKDAIASQVDGQQGQHIRQVQEQAAAMRQDPTVAPSDITAFEDADPAYAQFKQVMNGLSQTSAMGALVAAFASPFVRVQVLPSGVTADQVQGTGTYLTQQALAEATRQAQQAAAEPGTEASAGQQVPEAQAEAGQLVGAAGG